jgi:hypothetical protein
MILGVPLIGFLLINDMQNGDVGQFRQLRYLLPFMVRTAFLRYPDQRLIELTFKL